MKVILKFPLYIAADFDKNIDRAKATREMQKHLWPHVKEFLQDASFRRSVVRDLSEASGSECRIKIITESDLFREAGK
jgi:hypothetical protein